MAIAISVAALIISIVGVIVSAKVAMYVYKNTNKLNVTLHEDNQREDRIATVVSEYKRLLHTKINSNIGALIQAGIGNLMNEEEAREAIKRIANLQGQQNPLSNKQHEIEEIGVLRFFKNITHDQYKTPGMLNDIITNLRCQIKE